MAFSAYIMVYANVWDFRFNHISLTRHTPFSYGAEEPGAAGFDTAVWTRKAGWGLEDGACGGAPFDSVCGLRGMGVAVGSRPMTVLGLASVSFMYKYSNESPTIANPQPFHVHSTHSANGSLS